MAIRNYAQKVLKDCLPFDPAISLLGLYPQRDHKEKDLYKNILSCALCSGKKLENGCMSFNWGMAKEIVVSVGDGILLFSKE